MCLFAVLWYTRPIPTIAATWTTCGTSSSVEVGGRRHSKWILRSFVVCTSMVACLAAEMPSSTPTLVISCPYNVTSVFRINLNFKESWIPQSTLKYKIILWPTRVCIHERILEKSHKSIFSQVCLCKKITIPKKKVFTYTLTRDLNNINCATRTIFTSSVYPYLAQVVMYVHCSQAGQMTIQSESHEETSMFSGQFSTLRFVEHYPCRTDLLCKINSHSARFNTS